jgi:hypothetical protein
MRRASASDIAEINELLNHPAIRPTIGGDGHLDAARLIADGRNRFYLDERGCAAFLWRGPGIYEGHSALLVRGREALKAGRETLALMSDARMIWGLTSTSPAMKHVRWFNRQLGFRSHGMQDTPDGPCELFVLEN